jgi:hypothetical protein
MRIGRTEADRLIGTCLVNRGSAVRVRSPALVKSPAMARFSEGRGPLGIARASPLYTTSVHQSAIHLRLLNERPPAAQLLARLMNPRYDLSDAGKEHKSQWLLRALEGRQRPSALKRGASKPSTGELVMLPVEQPESLERFLVTLSDPFGVRKG